MQNARVTSKVVGPSLPPNTLQREALVLKLHETIGSSSLLETRIPQCKLILLCTPAGYGKTTLLAEYAHSTQLPCSWYFLEQVDRDRILFLTYLLASIRQCFPEFGVALDELLASASSANQANGEEEQYFDAILDALLSAITTEITTRFVIFLCNYHEVNESDDINHLVNRLLQNLPQQCTVIIESRAIPALELTSLLARREIIGLGSEVLQFNSQELRQLAELQQLPVLSEIEAEQLVRSFDGWIMGILLGTRLGKTTQLLSFLSQNFQQSMTHELWDLTNLQPLLFYLVDEVFKREPEAYTFLKEAAVLEQMTPTLCNALFEITNAAEQLNYIESQGLFVIHSGHANQITYRCHPIIRELFCVELQSQNPERFALLQQRVAMLLRDEQDYDRALHHALKAGQEAFAAEIIIEVYQRMITQGHIGILTHWINALSTDTVTQNPRLLFIQARLYLLTGEFKQARTLLEKASEILSKRASENDEDEDYLLNVEVGLAQSRVFFRMGEYLQAEAYCQNVLDHLPIDEIALLAEAYSLLGIITNLIGEFTIGITQLQKALQLWGRDKINRETAELHSILASSYGSIGNFALSEHHLLRAITCWDHLHDEWGEVYNLIRMGNVKQRQGTLTEAKKLFNEALTLSRGPIHFQRGEAYALVNLGEVYQEQEQYKLSLALLEDGIALARQVKDAFLTNSALSTLAMTYLWMNDTNTAMVILAETEPQLSYRQGAGYEKVLCRLALGTILLFQHLYEQAYTTLIEVEATLETIGLKRELLQTRLRITQCLLIQSQIDKVAGRIGQLITSAICDSYEQTVLIELKRLPNLYNFIMDRTEYVNLRTRLNLVSKEQVLQETKALSGGAIAPSTQPHFQILALGEPTIIQDDNPITRWRMAKAMELCFFLSECHRPMRKEQIIDALWTDVDEQTNQTFRSTVFYLRKALGETCLLYKNGTYQLDTKKIRYDVEIFCQHFQQAKDALQVKDNQAAKAELLEMVALYRGDYVQSFYSDWCIARRDELRSIYLEGRQLLARICWHLKQFDECVAHWQQVLVIDNCLEDAHYGLMGCYLKQGKRNLALRQYQRCSAILREELGIEPGTRIEDLYQHLRESSSTTLPRQ